jgi:hypothetical protein
MKNKKYNQTSEEKNMANTKQLNDKSHEEMTMGDEVPKSELMDGNHVTQQKHYFNNQTELNQQNVLN